MSQETPTAGHSCSHHKAFCPILLPWSHIMLINIKKREKKHSSKASRMSHKIQHSPRGPRTLLCSICEMPKVSAPAFLRWSGFVEFHSLIKAASEVALWASGPSWGVHRGAGINSSTSGWSGSSLLAWEKAVHTEVKGGVKGVTPSPLAWGAREIRAPRPPHRAIGPLPMLNMGLFQGPRYSSRFQSWGESISLAPEQSPFSPPFFLLIRPQY